MSRKLKFGKIEGDFHRLTNKLSETILKQFISVKKKLQKDLDGLEHTKNETLQKMQLEDAIKSLDKNITEVYKHLEGEIDENIKQMAQAVVNDQIEFLAELGIKLGISMTSIPADVLTELKFGKIYNEKWYLSDALWSDQKNKLQDINTIVSNGVAAGKSTYDIAKDLENYVDPKAAKSWDWSKVYPTSTKKIDYNAQRLARTVVSHAYERATIRAAKNNPFLMGIEWHSALSERSCELCIARDGKIFTPETLPLDHPNGMCTYSIVTPPMDEIADRLADWVNGADDAELDKWYKEHSDSEIKIKKSRAKNSKPNKQKYFSKTTLLF